MTSKKRKISDDRRFPHPRCVLGSCSVDDTLFDDASSHGPPKENPDLLPFVPVPLFETHEPSRVQRKHCFSICSLKLQSCDVISRILESRLSQ